MAVYFIMASYNDSAHQPMPMGVVCRMSSTPTCQLEREYPKISSLSSPQDIEFYLLISTFRYRILLACIISSTFEL